MLNFNIGDFFKRVTGTQGKELLFRAAVQRALTKHAGISVELGSIRSKGGTVNISGISAGAKSAIFIKKTAILEEINREQQVYQIQDIR